MWKPRRKTWAIAVPVSFLVIALLGVMIHPRARAALRLAPGFLQLPQDERVFYEPGGEAYAQSVAEALPWAVGRVEECHGIRFRSKFRVYVCASHGSFARHMLHPPGSPVRGAAFPWDVWISPKAFAFHGKDTHRGTLAHELSHLHLGQQLGWLHRVRFAPAWFSEALADWTAGTGREIISRGEAMDAVRSGRSFVPDHKGNLPLPKMPTDYGIPGPMLHSQALLFVEFLIAEDEAGFRNLIRAVIEGRRFEITFQEQFGDTLENVWGRFLESVRGR